MLRSTIQRRASARQIARQTSRHNNIPSSLSILLLPHVMNRKLHSVIRCSQVHIVHSSIRLLQFALLIQLILEELILVFSYSRVDKDVVNRAKPLDAGLESFALASPVGEVALQGKNAFRFDE